MEKKNGGLNMTFEAVTEDLAFTVQARHASRSPKLVYAFAG